MAKPMAGALQMGLVRAMATDEDWRGLNLARKAAVTWVMGGKDSANFSEQRYRYESSVGKP